MTNYLHKNDLPDDIDLGNIIAIDSETMGLNNHRDKLCVVQLSKGDGDAHLVQLDRETYDAPNLKKVLSNDDTMKIFHFARFDVAVIKKYLKVQVNNIYCTKIASKIARTYTDKHGLKDLCLEMLNKKISKQQQSSDWGASVLSNAQIDYAATDVLYLHDIKQTLDHMLRREDRFLIAQKCFDFLPTRAELDLMGWVNHDIFSHEAS